MGATPTNTHETTSSSLNDTNPSFPRQFLVRFQSKTHVLSIDLAEARTQTCNAEDIENNNVLGRYTSNQLLRLVADRTGWPCSCLFVSHFDFPFVQVRTRSSIRGGKGGFGTLLKGQSRQAGAKMTTDFGACRDLQGRRLRHVNDEIKLRKWRERQRREAAGEKVDTDAMWNTPSGLYNWHLMTPTWADISKKDTNRIKRQFKKMDRKLEKEAAMKKEKDEAYQNTMTHYLNKTNSMSESVRSNLSDAIRQGLSKKNDGSTKVNDEASKNKRKRTVASTEDFPIYSPDGDEQPNSLVSLTGDVVVEVAPGTDSVKLQSKSEFMTAVYVLEREGGGESVSSGSYYYEVTLVTGGLAQIGWACLTETSYGKGSRSLPLFSPSNDLGDGVGDDASSFAVDGSRGLKFHGGKEWKFPIQWKAGDRLGCRLHRKHSNENNGDSSISFTVNGKETGVAFTNCGSKPLVPAFSCNMDEILELHLTKNECKYFPTDDQDVAAVKVLPKPEPSRPEDHGKSDGINQKEKKSASVSTSTSTSTSNQSISNDSKADDVSALSTNNVASGVIEKIQEPVKPELIDLDQFKSVKELEELGFDRLKSALLALRVKCGGTLKQRAERLFSLKGLEYKDFPKKVRAKGFVEK